MTDQVNIQFKFTVDMEGTIFRDALYFSEAEWAVITPQEIANMKQERVDNWLAAINALSQQQQPEE